MLKKALYAATVTSLIFGIVFVPCITEASEPRSGGTLRIGVRTPQEQWLDVRYTTSDWYGPIISLIYNPLFDWGDKGYEGMVPSLATSYETKDNKTWTFRLRKGVKFHNGREMTAEDVKTNFEWRIKTPEGWKPLSYRSEIKYLKKVEALDRYTVRLTLDKPFSPLLRVMVRAAMRGIVPPEEVKKWGDSFNMHPCGTGPFKVVEVKPQEEVVMERFDGYWGPKPNVDRVIYKFYRSDEARLIALQKGELDVAYLFDEARPILDKDPNLNYEVVIYSGDSRKHVFNMRRWPMSDIRFRKAVWMGADWKNIIINSYAYKSGSFARTWLEYTKYFNPEAVALVPSYNPAEARKLIQAVEKDAGKKIPPINWMESNSSYGINHGEMAKVQLAQIGVPLNLQFLTPAVFIAKIPKAEWDLTGYGGGFGIEPILGLTYFQTDAGIADDGKSLPGYSNSEFDGWLMKAEAAKTEKERARCYHEAEKIMLRDAPGIMFNVHRVLIAYSKKVQGLRITDMPIVPVTNTWANVWLEQ